MIRPITFTPEVAAALCDRIVDGASLREVCRAEDMPSRETVRRWCRDNETFRTQYAKAVQDLTDAWLEEIIDISDDARNDYVERRRQDGTIERVPDPEQVARSKLRVHARQWAMARMQPRKYGDRVAIGGDADVPPIKVEHRTDTELARAVALVLAKGRREMDDGTGPTPA